MSTVLIVGGGLAGAAVAKELAASGKRALIVEASDSLGGKVRDYGCKATDKCSNCGVCLVNGLWEGIEKNPLVDVRLNTKLIDLTGGKERYTAAFRQGGVVSYISGISDVVVATGFKRMSFESGGGSVEVSGAGKDANGSITMGSDIERIMKDRSGTDLFEREPRNVAFIQCFGSRDRKENAMYCSRVCCAYSSRAAKLIKQYYPDCGVTFFYMEMQQVRSGDYFEELKQLGVNFIKCRPIKVAAGDPATVTFDNPETGAREKLEFDKVVLSDGIRPSDDAARIAEICGLGQTADGFLKYVSGPEDAKRTGIYIAGCVGGPAKIEETYAEGISVARSILF